jgi:hypothetical protein
MKKINIELDMLHFMVAYQYLLLASKHSQKKVGFNHMIFREAFEEIDKQFTKQYTEEHGEEFEHQHELRETIFKINTE